MSEKKFYVYVHRYASGPKEGQVFYVGKGSKDRHTVKWRLYNPYWTNITNKYGFTSEIIMRFENEDCAFSLERALIKHHGRENLCNLTDGGDGASGIVRSDESKAAMSKRMLGNRNAVGTVPSKETRMKISETKIAERNPNYDPTIYTFNHDEHGIFIGTQNEFNNEWMPDTRRASFLTSGRFKVCLGWWIGDGPKPKRDYSKEREARSKARTGKTLSENTKEKISKSKTGQNINQEIYTFYHHYHGIEICRKYDLVKKYGLNSGSVHNVVSGKEKSTKGWRII